MTETVAIIGVGVIGGSVARAARRADPARMIIGVDRSEANCQRALELGVIDVAGNLPDAVAEADIVVIATPVGSFLSIFQALKPVWRDSSVYTDVGSTKASMLDDARAVFGEVPANFVPAHPIAGSESSGVEASSAELFDGRRVILTPTAETAPEAYARVERFWNTAGALTSRMDPGHHDEVLAATSHLPHILAFGLVDLLGKKDTEKEILTYAAGGFRDFTRIASSDPQMWLDICRANHHEIALLIREFIGELELLAEYMDPDNDATEQLREVFIHANETRRRFLDMYNDKSITD